MENNEDQLEAISDIRRMMRQSSRFLSLSGLSGVLAGTYALLGVGFICYLIDQQVPGGLHSQETPPLQSTRPFIITAFVVLLLSLLTVIWFSAIKAKKRREALFDHTAYRLIINMLIPLGTGGIFCLALLREGSAFLGLICPVMLLFYGMALVNGSKYTLHDIRYLGCIEIALGLIGCFLPEWGLFLWGIGFGVLHIVYGGWMWFRYDREI